jgi:hypothetical protein
METPIGTELSIQARDGEIRGTLTQSSVMYVVEFESSGDDFQIYSHDKTTGNRQDLGTEATLSEAIDASFRLMGNLAHNPFPGFGPTEED